MKKVTGAILASMVAGIMISGKVMAEDTPTAAEAKVKCSGINSCKGTSACHSADNACAGQNACKGKGWIEVNAKECTDKGGTVVKK